MYNKSLFNIYKTFAEDKFLILIPLLTIAVRAIIFSVIPIIWEDAYITFRYAENFANGNGLVYNLGEYVYGTTTPFFAIILGAFYLIGIPCFLSSLIINLIAESITSIIVYKFLKDFTDRTLAGILALLFVFSPANISWSIQGMETAFFTSIIGLSFYALYKEKFSLALFLGFFASIIRIDGLSVPFVIFISLLLNQRLKAFKYLLFPLIMFFVWELLLFLYFGSPLPNSMMAKLVLYSGHETSMLPNFEYILSRFFTRGYYTSSLFTLFFLIGIAITLIKKNNYSPMIAWFFIYYFALIYSKTMLFGWYFVPPLFVYIIISGIGIAFITEKINNWLKLKQIALQYLLILGLLFFSVLVVKERIDDLSLGHAYQQNVLKKLALYIKENSNPEATIYLEPIGAIGYYSERYIYDDAGLVSPIFIELNRLPYTAYNRYKKIDLVKPVFIVLRNHEIEDFYLNSDLLNEYQLIKNFEFKMKPDDYIYAEMFLFKRIH